MIALRSIRPRWWAFLPWVFALGLGLFLTACSGDSVGPGGGLNCDGVPGTVLDPGAYTIVDPTVSARPCLRLPAAGSAGAEHLVVVLSASAEQTANGVSGNVTLASGPDHFQPAPPTASLLGAPSGALAFHAMLRRREQEIASRPEMALSRGLGPVGVPTSPPMAGDHRTFRVCATPACVSFVSVAATARYAGSRIAIFLDDTVPAGGYSDADLQTLGALFDSDLYPIDTTAFGRESDIDGNGVVSVLLSDQINALSPGCEQNGQLIVGYFFGLDLDRLDPNSNRGEVFYAAVPDPARPLCFGRSFMLNRLGPVAIHEFQHMISFNRHVLLGSGAPEDTWLNEGLSHFAEELGGRELPAAACAPIGCLTQYAAGNLQNAYEYLQAPARYFLIEPGNSSGTLPERGANWLFVRWLADHFGADSAFGTAVTRRLLGADQAGGIQLVGGANVVAAARAVRPDVAFADLLGEWHLANYAENQTGFVEPTGRLQYRSWDLPLAFRQLVLGPYPLVPDSIGGAGGQLSDMLRGGSGYFFRAVQGANAGAVAIGIETSNTAALAPRIAVLRVR